MNNFRHFFFYLAVVLILLFPGNTLAQNSSNISNDNTEYFGKFDAELVPDTRQFSRLVFKPLKNPAIYKFAHSPEKDAVITTGKIYDLRKSGGKFDVVLIERVKNSPSVCVDLNTDAAFSESECFAMIASKDSPDVFEYTLKLPIKTPLFDSFPVLLHFRRGFTGAEMQSGDRLLMQSQLGYAAGHVNLKNRSILVLYQFDAGDGTISITEGLMGIDANSDGKIKNEPFSNETSYASNDEIVFRVGDMYLSTTRVDTVKNQIVMRTRRAEEYRRAELEVGKLMPDFSFVDFKGKKKTLVDFREKYLLVDFWGLWCIDCRRGIPYQFEAYKRFRARGFEILGMDTDENMEQVKTVLQKSGITWTQARFDSIKDLINQNYRIQEYPSAVLLGPDGKVLVLDQSLIADEELLKTLDRILPR
jgi:thiol-disulfide isomerase/thioredoxin